MKRACKTSSDNVRIGELFRRRTCSAQLQKPPASHFCRDQATSSRVQGNQANWIREFTTKKPETSVHTWPVLHLETEKPDASVYQWPNIGGLFLDKWRSADDSMAKKHLIEQVSVLKDELLKNSDDVDSFVAVLEEKGAPLFRRYPNGSAIVELLKQLGSSKILALQVFSWRRQQVDYMAPMTTEEYSRGIIIAGRLKYIDLATEIFQEAANKNLKATSTYNALMSAYIYNGLPPKCQLLFRELKQEPMCSPTIITYNILLSMFGRLVLIDHVEATLREIKDLNLSPTVSTYNNVLSAYITAWMWDKMDKTYMIMKAEDVKPDLTTYLLMLRGYAHSGELRKMEDMYEVVKDHVNSKEISLIRAMICAYCRSSVSNRIEKIEEMLKLIPEDGYRPWLNVLLIRVYANDDLLERMENSITEAIEHNISVTTSSIMHSIVGSYFRNGSVDKLANFVKRAETAGWKICRSLYHTKMVLYSSQRRLAEMENVLDEMGKVNINLSKKTFWILYKAYLQCGQKNRAEQVRGMMCKHGYGVPSDACCS